MTEHTTSHQENVLQVFRGVAHNLSAQSEKAAAREHELKDDIGSSEADLAELTQQIAKLGTEATDLERDLTRMRKELADVSAARASLSQQGAYAYSVIKLAEKASLTETLTDGSLDVSGQVDGTEATS